jgi:hypothetical protein
VTRDLGQGVNVELGIFYEQGNQVSVTLLFRFWDGELELSPEGIRLNVFPNERIYRASGVRRATYKSKDERCAPHGEWLHLSFPVERKNLGQIALVFPDDAVARGNSIIRVRPFRFERTADSDTGGSTPPPPLTITAAPTAQERLKSCDPTVALGAAEEILANKSTLREPLQMFPAAIALFQYGSKDEAVFWFYAAQLRTRYQLVFQGGDRGQLLRVMMMTTGEPINNYAFQDIAKLARTLDRVVEWDTKTSNPFRDKPRTEANEKEIQKIYSGLRDMKAKLVAEKDDLENKARAAAPHVQGFFVRGANESRAKHCPGSGQQATEGRSTPPREEYPRIPSRAPSAASVQSVADTLTKWGLSGTWALDCSKPPSSGNVYATYVGRTDGTAFVSRNFGAANRNNGSVELESASVEPDGMIVLRSTFSGKLREWGFVKLPKGRVRMIFSREVGGDYAIRDGKVLSVGSETPWIAQCRQS